MSDDSFKGSIYDQMRANRWRTLYLFIIFPVLAIGLTYIGLVLAILFGSEGRFNIIGIANEMMSTVGFWVLVGVIIWAIISYFLGSRMIMAFAGAKPIEKRDNKMLYRAVENASIAAGLPKTPDIYIINDQSMNAFATGTSPMNAKVAISKGMLDKLEKNEIEGVMAHEIGHVLNRDIRVLLLSVAMIGAIEMIGEILVRTRGGGSSRKGNPLIIIGLLFLTVGVLIGTLTRLAISREREYLADAIGAHLISNPDALASALQKISGDARIEVLDGKASMAGLCIADPTESGHIKHQKSLHAAASGSTIPVKEEKPPSGIVSFWKKIWSTHPPIMDRIRKLRGY
jgi:heat shock protein HtpX